MTEQTTTNFKVLMSVEIEGDVNLSFAEGLLDDELYSCMDVMSVDIEGLVKQGDD